MACKDVETDGRNGDGQLLSGAYEVTDGAIRKYYAIAGMTVAVDDGSGLQYLLTDHLGSIVAVTDASGTLTSQQRYLPFGEVRTDIGNVTQTDFSFTGQRSLDAQGHATIGLLDYHARFYDAALGRFISPDSVIPGGGPQNLNRYSYVVNRPINLSDPSGHMETGPCGAYGEECGSSPVPISPPPAIPVPSPPPSGGENDGVTPVPVKPTETLAPVLSTPLQPAPVSTATPDPVCSTPMPGQQPYCVFVTAFPTISVDPNQIADNETRQLIVDAVKPNLLPQPDRYGLNFYGLENYWVDISQQITNLGRGLPFIGIPAMQALGDYHNGNIGARLLVKFVLGAISSAAKKLPTITLPNSPMVPIFIVPQYIIYELTPS